MPSADQYVTVRLGMLKWLQLGLREGRVAASPYAIRDAVMYAELDEAIKEAEGLDSPASSGVQPCS